MDLVTAMRPRIMAKILPGLLLALAAFPALILAQPDRGGPPASSGAPSFEVLSVKTGSGPRRHEDKQDLRVEILEIQPRSPAEAARSEALAGPGLAPDQREAKARAAALETALERWHNRTLAEYDHKIAGLRDPFMPIRSVRGQPDPAEVYEAEELVSPILRLDLDQLRLVAITTRSGIPGAGGALASFEDQSGASYILRLGDRIGRRRGRIISITENTVTVEEPPSSPGAPSRVTEIKLGGLYASGQPALDGPEDDMFITADSGQAEPEKAEDPETHWLSILSNL